MDWEKIIREVESAVREAEIKFGRGTGRKKRAMAVELLNRLLNVPLLPECAEAQVIGLLVDFAVAWLNRRFGRRWVDVLPMEAADG